MSVLQKLKDLKRVLDRNLATRSQDVLPVLNECIKELETPAIIEIQKENKTIKDSSLVSLKKDIMKIKFQDPAAQDIYEEVIEIINKHMYIKWSVVMEQREPIKQKQPKDTTKPKQEEITAEINNKDTRDIEKEAKQFLKENWVSNRKFLKWQKAVNKAIELWFTI